MEKVSLQSARGVRAFTLPPTGIERDFRCRRHGVFSALSRLEVQGVVCFLLSEHRGRCLRAVLSSTSIERSHGGSALPDRAFRALHKVYDEHFYRREIRRRKLCAVLVESTRERRRRRRRRLTSTPRRARLHGVRRASRRGDVAARVHVRTHVGTLRSARFDAGSPGDDADSRGSGRRRRRRRAVVRVQEVSRHRQVLLQGL